MGEGVVKREGWHEFPQPRGSRSSSGAQAAKVIRGSAGFPVHETCSGKG